MSGSEEKEKMDSGGSEYQHFKVIERNGKTKGTTQISRELTKEGV